MANEGFRSSIPTCTLGGMPVASLSRADTVRVILDAALKRRTDFQAPLFMTSANAQAISSKAARAAYGQADVIGAESRLMVTFSKLFCKTPVPERSSTAEIYHEVAKKAPDGLSFFLFGSTQDEVEQAVLETRRLYPHIKIAGWSHGYLSRADEEALLDRLDRAKPDILWIGHNVAKQQQFVARHRARLKSVRVIKTCEGLFKCLSGATSQAPQWMQKAGLDWAYGMWQARTETLSKSLMTTPQNLFFLLARSH